TWAHDIIDPISRFISFDISELRISWDNVMSRATRERNNSDNGPIKKPDIFGTYTNVNGKYNWEILYGEVSNGPFTNMPQSKVHKIEDRVKLEKFAKDSIDNAFKRHARSYYSDFQKLNIFLLQSS
ncbi:20931_t:CDS:2, partial [Cetraspora pellucida]